MNNRPSINSLSELVHYTSKLFLINLSAFVLMSFAVYPALGQKVMWQYVTTWVSGNKTYLNTERKSLAGKNLGAWEQMVSVDGTSMVSLVEWDCASKRRLIHQVIFYDSRKSAVGSKKSGFNWVEVVPGSAGDFLYHRICLPPVPLKWARITTDNTSLRVFPDNAAPVARVALKAEKFLIVPETGVVGWFNIVDPETQQDYWLFGDWFDTIEEIQPPKKRSAAASNTAAAKTAPAVKKRKPQPRTNARKTKN